MSVLVVVTKSGSGRYNLACFLFTGRKRQCLRCTGCRWLALKEEETDADWATKDRRPGGRCVCTLAGRGVLAYLRKCQQYWETSGFFRDWLLILPRQAVDRSADPGVHWAAPIRATLPTASSTPPSSQALADEMGVAFLGVSGTIPYGKETFSWSEDPAKDSRGFRRPSKK